MSDDKLNLFDWIKKAPISPKGVEAVVQMLKKMNHEQRERLLQHISGQNPPLFELIQKQLFTFRDLEKLEVKAIQLLLAVTPKEVLVKALKPCSVALKQKMLSAVSTRVREMIEDDIQRLGLIKLSEVEKAQEFICQKALELEKAGKIIIPGKTDDIYV